MIRIAMQSDVVAMADIYEEAIRDQVHANCDTSQPDLAKFARGYFFGNGRYTTLINETDDRCVVGWGALKRFSALPWDDSVAEVAVYIRRGHRSRGTGVRLLQALVAHAEAAKFYSVVAIILSENVPSIRGCYACGFECGVKMPSIASLYGATEDVVWMQKLLTRES
ncbi:MAG TPA: GNAT family N-acetyltransferase [Steroidobacteraceae bacterium]